MKETVKLAIIIILVVFFAAFFSMTRGKDELNWNIELPKFEEEFSYPVYASQYNGLYRSEKSNGVYAMVGKNSDDTYKVYFIRTINSTKTIVERIENANMVNEKISFTDANNVRLTIEFSKNEMRVPKELGMGNAQLEGGYLRTKDINIFSMSEFKY